MYQEVKSQDVMWIWMLLSSMETRFIKVIRVITYWVGRYNHFHVRRLITIWHLYLPFMDISLNTNLYLARDPQ